MHEYWLVCPTHVLFSFNRAPCTQPRCFRCSLTYKRPPQWWRYLGVLDAAIKHVDVFLAPSRFCKDLHQRMGLNAPIVHLPNFVPAVDGATPPTAGQPVRAVREDPQKPYFLFVGRLEKLKGLQTLLPIFRRYHKAQLFVAGTGSEESRLRQCVGDSANIHFLGYLSDRQLQALYQQAVAVIIPSVWYENFPLVIIEAFRQRTPVIVRNLGGMLEIVAESGGGFVYETDEELVAAMDKLLADASCRRELGLRGYQAYRQKWTTEAHLQRYFALIDEVATTRDRYSARRLLGGRPLGEGARTSARG